MEHGNIVIWYGANVSEAERTKLTEFYEESPNAMLVTPLREDAQFVKYPRHEPLGSKIALTAWTAPAASDGTGVLAVCPEVDVDAFTAFRDEFRGRGPERFPLESLRPGA